MKEFEGEFSRENVVVELPRHLKQKIIDEVLQRLGSLNGSSKNISHSQVMAKERGERVLVGCADKHLLLVIPSIIK